MLLGNVETCRRIPNFLKVDNIAWLEEGILLAGSLFGELRCLVMFFSRTCLGTLVDGTIRSLGQLLIAPVSEVGEEDL